MIILGGSYYNGPKSIFTGTAIIKDVNKIVLQNGIYDRLYVSEDISKQEIVDTYTSEAAKSVKIESGINRIETIDVYGKTTQEGTGDASPSNVRRIKNTGVFNKRITIDQNSTIIPSGEASIVGTSRRFNVKVDDLPETLSTSQGIILCNLLPPMKSSDTYQSDVAAVSIQNDQYSQNSIQFRVPGCKTEEEIKAWLKNNPLDVIYQSTEDTGDFYTGIEITQGDEYRCEIIELQDRLHEGDKVETNVQSEYDAYAEFDGSSDERWNEDTNSTVGTDGSKRLWIRVLGARVDNTSNDTVANARSNFLSITTSNDTYTTKESGLFSFTYILDVNALQVRIAGIATISALKTYLQKNPLKIWYKSTSGGTGKNVRRETHVKKQYVFTGTENIQKSGLSNNSFYINFNDIAQNGSVGAVICNQAKALAETDIASSRIWGVSGSTTNSNTFRISSPETTVDAVKAKFTEQYSAGTPFIIEYELAQPKVFADEPVIVENKAGEYTVSFESTGRVKLKPVINQEGWSDDTIIDAGFNGDLAGGNVDFTAESIDKIRIKRRKKGIANWVDLKDITINVPDDFTFTFYDLFAANAAEYTYAVVPVIGDIEGNLSTVDIQSMFNGFFIADKNTIYGTEYNVNVGAATKNEKSSVVQTLGAKYPFIIDNGYNNYYTVPISLFFYNPNLDWQQNVQYRQTIVEWLHNGTAKIFKSEDGRIWLAKVTTAPVLTPGSNLNITSIDFSITEIGESNSTEDLYNSGLLSLIKES